MAINRLYLAHHHSAASEVHMLAEQLRLHGIVPWVDKSGGFKIADHSPTEARRAISEDCFGLLLYATEAAFDSGFIRNIEIDEALRRHRQDPNFMLFTVPRNMSFSDLRSLSMSRFGFDLSPFHTVAIPQGADIEESFRRVANGVVERLLLRARDAGASFLSLQFSTRELLPDEPEDLLCIDGTRLLTSAPNDPRSWARLLQALRDIKARVAATLGRPRLRVHGSKHLTAAFMFGRVFARFEMDIRQTASAIWSTDAKAANREPLAVTLLESTPTGAVLVEVASGKKDVPTAVDAYIEKHALMPAVRIQFHPEGADALNADNSLCLAMVEQTYAELERVMRGRQTDGLHIFAAAPQAFMMMLGRMFSGMPATHLYEWTGTEYVYACRIPGGVI